MRARFWILAAVGVAAIAAVGVLVWQPWDSGGGTDELDVDDAGPGSPSTITPVEPGSELLVTNVDDAGEGSLRAAITAANEAGDAVLIVFDNSTGVFDEPQIIQLAEPLPEITGEVIVDGYIKERLWQATGVTISAGGNSRVLTVAENGRLTLRSLTITEGAESDGGGLLNRGALALTGVTLVNNHAEDRGGAVLNDGGELTVVNSTFFQNSADVGGGFANIGGAATVVNSTFSENGATDAGGLYNDGELVVANTILANSDGVDCVSTTELNEGSTNNLIETNDGCGTPISSDDPGFESFGYFNGPTMTLPIKASSPATNLGDNAVAVDEFGQPLAWDQRGNGDPRFVAGFTDIGAFEVQAFPDLTVDTVEDVALRACSGAIGDCPLRAAIQLANATPEPDTIVFDPGVFSEPTTLLMDAELPEVTSDLVLDASTAANVTIEAPGGLRTASDADLELIDVTVR